MICEQCYNAEFNPWYTSTIILIYTDFFNPIFIYLENDRLIPLSVRNADFSTILCALSVVVRQKKIQSLMIKD